MEKWIQIIVYIVSLGICYYVINALKIEHLFKKNHQFEIVMFYILVSMGLAYLVANFILGLRVL